MNVLYFLLNMKLLLNRNSIASTNVTESAETKHWVSVEWEGTVWHFWFCSKSLWLSFCLQNQRFTNTSLKFIWSNLCRYFKTDYFRLLSEVCVVSLSKKYSDLCGQNFMNRILLLAWKLYHYWFSRLLSGIVLIF